MSAFRLFAYTRSNALNLVAASLLLVAMSRPVVGDQNDPTGDWDVDANGFVGTLKISSIDANGNLSGTLFGNPLTGFYEKTSGKIIFVRIIKSGDPKANQVYMGYFMTDSTPESGYAFVEHFAGSFEAFSGTGATAKRNVYGWYATQKTKLPA